MSGVHQVTSVPIAGFICPACGHGEDIHKVTRTRPLGFGDLFSAWIFGFLGIISAFWGRSDVRLKCARCGCQFPKPTSPLSQIGLWLVATVILTILAIFVAIWQEATMAGSQEPDFLRTISGALQDLSAKPLRALALLVVPTFMVLLGFVAGATARRRERTRAWKAVCRRSMQEAELATNGEPVAEPPA